MDFLDNNVIIILVRKSEKIVIVILFSLLVLVSFSQVIARYVFNSPLSWSEEMARYIHVWLILITSPICIRKGRHLKLDFLSNSLPFKYKKPLKIIINLLVVMLYLYIMVIYGWKTVIVNFGSQNSPAMQIPMYLIYLALPISGLLMILENLISLLKLIGLKNNNDL